MPIPKPEKQKLTKIKLGGKTVEIGSDEFKPIKGVSSDEVIKKLEKGSIDKIFPVLDLNA